MRFIDVVRQIVKALLTLFGLSLTLVLCASGGEIDDLAGSILTILPKNSWSLESGYNSLVITGPKIRVIWPVSLPDEPEELWWRKYSQSARVQITIKFQSKISDVDLRELRTIRDRFYIVAGKEADRTKKEWREDFEEYGDVHLPDYRSASASIFVHRSTDNFLVRPASALEVISRIDALLASKFEKVLEEKSEKKKKVNQPVPTTQAP